MTECGCNSDPKTVIGFFVTYFFEEKVSKNLFTELRGCSHIVIKTAAHKQSKFLNIKPLGWMFVVLKIQY